MRQLVKRAAIELLRRDDLAARFHQRVEHQHLRRMARCHRQRCRAAFQRRDLAFKRGIGGVHDAGVDVPEFLERKQVRGMFGAVENITCGLVDRGDPRIGCRIGLASGVNGQGFGAEFGHRMVLAWVLW